MDSYRVSKAWHISRELVRDIQILVREWPADAAHIQGNLRKLSVGVPMHLAGSVNKKRHSEKLHNFHEAREMVIELQKWLTFAKHEKYVEAEKFEELITKAIEAQNLLSQIIRKTAVDAAAAKE